MTQRWLSSTAGWIALAIAALVTPFVVGGFGLNVATAAGISGIFAMGLSLLVLQVGLPSLGHAAFFGAAAYTVAILTRSGINVVMACAAGVIVATALGALLGPVLLRTRGVYFLMATLAVGEVLHNLAISLRSITGGDDGISGIPALEVGPLTAASQTTMYYLVLVVLALVVFGVARIHRSPLGSSLRAVRDNRQRYAALGASPMPLELSAFTISAGIAGLAGVLFAVDHSFVAPGVLSVEASGNALLMVVLGGTQWIIGPVIGAAVVETIRLVGGAHTERWLLLLGVSYVAIALGLLPRLRMRLGRGFWPRRAAPAKGVAP